MIKRNNLNIILSNMAVMAILMTNTTPLHQSGGSVDIQNQIATKEITPNDDEPDPRSAEAVEIHQIEYQKLNREENLRKFFTKHNSPLVESASTFVAIADTYGIDYRLVPAISGVESTFCKNIIEGTHNCYGWGIYGNNVIRFESYDEGIEKVAEGLNKGYFAKGADTVEEIAPIYNPNTPREWGGKVRFFMNQIAAET